MRFQPKSEAAIQSEIQEAARKFGPWRNGIYDFEVTESEERLSKAGNEMIVLTVAVYNEDGEKKIIADYLLEAIAVKLKHAADACGAGDKYAAGTLTSVDFYGKTGRLKLGIQAGQDGFPAKNVIRDYIAEPRLDSAPKFGAPKQREPVGGGSIDDEIPF